VSSNRTRSDSFTAGLSTGLERSELLNGRVVDRSADVLGDSMARGDLFFAFKNALEEAKVGLNVFTYAALVQINENTVRMPDSIVQTPGGIRARVVAEPLIVTDIKFSHLSKGEMQQRLEDYFSVASVRHYLVIDRERGLILHHERRADSIVTHIVRHGAIAFDGFEVQVAKLLGHRESEVLAEIQGAIA
jgi:hypothetical protein